MFWIDFSYRKRMDEKGMKSKKEIKTNVMRLLEQAEINYKPIYYEIPEKSEFSGKLVAELCGLPETQSFKTLAARNEKNQTIIFVLPVSKELHLKRAAAAVGSKSIALLPMKALYLATGYSRGEVSPVGLKKSYPIWFDQSAEMFEEIIVSAGKKGASVQVQAKPLFAYLKAHHAAICHEE